MQSSINGSSIEKTNYDNLTFQGVKVMQYVYFWVKITNSQSLWRYSNSPIL
jgi:hypothetical protein